MSVFPRVILASASPRRRELMEMLGVPFEVVSSGLEERIPDGRFDPALAARRLAHHKAARVASQHADAVVIGADTLVCVGRAVLGKPDGPEDARRMLRALSGRTHRVITGVAVCAPDATARAAEITWVTFRTLDPGEIDGYVRSGEPLDKAGAYGIQAGAAKFVAALSGCYYNVVGLPVVRLARMLRAVGVGTTGSAAKNDAWTAARTVR